MIPDHFFVIFDSMQDTGENSLDGEEEELPPLQPEPKNLSRTSASRRSFTDTERTDPEDHSPTRVLHAITPIPVLSAGKRTGRLTVGAVLLTSKSNREHSKTAKRQRRKIYRQLSQRQGRNAA